MDKWSLAQKKARELYESETGCSWEDADKYEREDRAMFEYEKLNKENETMRELTRDSKGRFVSTKNNENKKENGVMMNKEMRMETLKANGVDTSKFFTVSVNAPVGATVTITIDGVPYTVSSNENNEITDIQGGEVTDKVVKEIIDRGYVFNRRTDGRWITAQTFQMLNSYLGWDRYLRERYGYMYQFEMLADELHRLARMERDNDPDFERLSQFFTKDVVVSLCYNYIRHLKKYVKTLPVHKCKGVPYVKLNRYGDVFVKDLGFKVYGMLEYGISRILDTDNYAGLEVAFKLFVESMCKLPWETAMCPEWKSAFKGKGAYVTLLNIIKFHGVTINGMNTYDSVKFVEDKLFEYKGEYWRFHQLLKKVIEDNNFTLTY